MNCASDAFTKTLEAYGLNLPRVVDVRPTNLPAIEAKELHLDNIFIMEDGSWSIIDYESDYNEKKKVKYLGYVAQLAKRMYNDDNELHPIRVIVIYTADVKRGTTDPVMNMGALNLRIDEAFLSDLDSAEIRDRVTAKLDRGEALNDMDLMQLIIYPLTYDGKEAKQKAVGEAIDLAERIKDESKSRFMLAAINVFADKVITKDDRGRIRRLIEMTKLGREYWEDAFNSGKGEGREEGREEERIQNQQKLKSIIRNLLMIDVSPEKVSECTGVPIEEVREIAEDLLQKT